MAGRLTGRDQRRIAERGFAPLPADTALAVLGRLLEVGATRATVLAADWSTVAAALGNAIPPLVGEMATLRDAPGPPSDARLLCVALAETEPRERRDVLALHVRRQLARVLGLDANEPIDPFQGLTDLGMDSLMAVELSSRLSVLVRRALPSTFALEEPTLHHVVDHLAALLSDEFDMDAPPRLTAPPDDGLAALSEDELRDALLRELEATGY
jgi:acyl carrier protein